LENNDKMIQKAESFIRRYASMIGHNNADSLMDVIVLAKKQEIEIERLNSSINSEDTIKNIKDYAELAVENKELNNFKETTEAIVGDVIFDLIKERMADN
jgi:hypothetical protein